MERTVRRLAALLAADVVGYSGKIEADESSTLASLKDVRATTIDPLLAENSGRIVKTMGDGFIAEFGSVVDAVTFAVAMQKSVPERQQGTAPEKRLVFRIGINLGDVVVEGDDLRQHSARLKDDAASIRSRLVPHRRQAQHWPRVTGA